MLVTMVNSVDEYVAGEQYDLDEATGNRFVVLGYATAPLEREILPEEVAVTAGDDQLVDLGTSLVHRVADLVQGVSA